MTHQPHFTCFSSLITHLAVVNITPQQQGRPYPLLCLGWSLLWIYEGLWKWSRSSLLIIDFLSKMHTQNICQHWEEASQSNTDTSGQKTPRLNHGPTPVLSNWLSSIHVCGRGNILNSQKDWTVVITPNTVPYPIWPKYVCAIENMTHFYLTYLYSYRTALLLDLLQQDKLSYQTEDWIF